MTLDLSKVRPCLAGPKRPQDRIPLEKVKAAFGHTLGAPHKDRGFEVASQDREKSVKVKDGITLTHGDVVIASITSCTNTSNPGLLVSAGLLARKAVARGLKVPAHVRTSFAPGSRVVEDYLQASGLLISLETLGFHIVGFGCATCIGNSGPLPEEVAEAIRKGDLVAASVLSGNRNFEGRINPLTKANYLASPALVVAYALAGTVCRDMAHEPVGQDKDGKDVFLKDLWPSRQEVEQVTSEAVKGSSFRERYAHVFEGTKEWQEIQVEETALFPWDEKSTYIRELPFFTNMPVEAQKLKPMAQARVLVRVGDSVTTDHISPAGVIPEESPAGTYLKALGVSPRDFNSYGSRRGNDRVMVRGTFANIRLRNLLAPGTEGSWTRIFPSGERMSIFDAAQFYREIHVPLIVLAGKEYGTGSSRDWAAKGPALLGVRVVLAQSFERIHRSNLAGVGILPLEFTQGDSPESLGLQGDEAFDFKGIDDSLRPGSILTVKASSPQGRVTGFSALCRLDTPAEITYFRNGGILQTVLRKLLKP